jgi:Flp pilus assembly protein TadD
MIQAGALALRPGATGAMESLLNRVATSADEVAAHRTRRDSNKMLRRALLAWRRGDTAKAAGLALEATEIDETNGPAFSLLAITLEKLGHLHKALVTYERAFQLNPADTDLLLNLGLTAWTADNLAGAEKMFRLFIAACPDRPEGHNNLASVIRDQGRPENAIEGLRLAIYRMPHEPMLWNTMGTLLAETGRSEESLIFYAEALRLDPGFGRIWHNLGFAYMHLGRHREALEAYDKALTLITNKHERMETLHSRSICLIGLGALEEGFREYEIRNAYEFRTHTVHSTKAPLWRGEPLAGKRILLGSEQGLGDEFMFANIIPDLVEAVGPRGKVQIAVDDRAVSLFQRSFPEADVGPYRGARKDGKNYRLYRFALEKGDPDFHVPAGSVLQYLRKRIEDFPRRAFLKADRVRAQEFRARLEATGSGPYVGICWRSMVMGPKRGKYYSAIEAWKPILTLPGVRFVNLQYGDIEAELAEAERSLGVSVHRCADLDLKNDLDGGAALSEACDLVISAPTAAAALAGAIGKETWFITAGPAWPQLGTDHYPWYRKTRAFSPEKFADWDTLMPQVRDALGAFAKP